MKITKSQLRKIIKEEMADVSAIQEEEVLEKLSEVLVMVDEVYMNLPTDISKELFANYLLKNIDQRIENWEEDRQSADMQHLAGWD